MAAVFSGQAMAFLQGYADTAFDNAVTYLNQLNAYVSGTIDTSPPVISIDVSQSMIIDPTLRDGIPDPPADSEYPVIPGTPVTQTFDFPSKPVYSLPTAPTLTDIVIPEFVEGTIAGITMTIPTSDFGVPSIGDISTSDVPLDALFQTIRDKLSSNILNGGTMLDPSVEADIWDRDLERNEQALQDIIDKATTQWAKLGWSLPDGLLAGQMLAIQNEYANKRLDRSREISVKQAELEQAGMFKSLELGINYEQIIMGSQNEYAKRVLEASKTTADVTIELYKQRVVQYNSLLEAFKSDVMAYKTSIEAEAVRAEAYKARIAGLQTIASIDESRVKLYTGHIAAIEQLVNVYNTEVKAVATMYEAEKTKIEGFKVQVEAYSASIDAVTKKYLAGVEGYKSYVQAWVASADSQTKLLDLKSRGDIAELEATLKAWEIQMKLIQESTNVKLEALKTVAQTSSNLAAGALSAIHASVSDSYNNSYSTSKNYSYLGT
jgi:hypothetical protein